MDAGKSIRESVLTKARDLLDELEILWDSPTDPDITPKKLTHIDDPLEAAYAAWREEGENAVHATFKKRSRNT